MRVDWKLLDDDAQQKVGSGDLVSVEAGGAPTWRVLKVTDGRAWLRDDIRRLDCIAPLAEFHWTAQLPNG